MATLTATLSILAALVLACAAGAAEEPNGLVIILTDYGDADHYVGMLKGAIYSVSTDVKVDTITNEVWPFDIPDGAFMLYEAAALFPPGTTFIALVDPGSGKDRMPIALKTRDGKYFVGPDNGLLDLVADRLGTDEIRLIASPALMRKKTASGIFCGYDVFGPVAAHIATGTPFDRVGPIIVPDKLISLPEAALGEDGTISGNTLHVDHFGNIITNIEPEHIEEAGFEEGDILTIKLDRKKVRARLSNNYGDVSPGDCVCIIDDCGFMEIAINQGSLVHRLKLKAKPDITISAKKKQKKWDGGTAPCDKKNRDGSDEVPTHHTRRTGRRTFQREDSIRLTTG